MEKNREKLYNYGQPLFQNLKNKYGITHFYFILPDGHDFVRLHNKEIYGDLIERITFQKARDTKKIASGIELGKTAFALRAVIPYYNNGELIGYVELGEDMDHIFKILKNQTSDDFAIIVDKDYLNREDWKSVRQTAGLRDNWNDLEKHLVISSTNTNNDEITAKCFVEDNLERVEKGELLLQQLQSKNQTFVCGGFSVTDGGGRHIGSILSLIDITDQMAIAQKASYTLFSVAIILFISTLTTGILISRYISKPITKLRDAANSIGEGNFDTKIEIKSKDEIGELAASFKRMTGELQKTTVSKEYVDNIIRSIFGTLVVVAPDGTIQIVNKTACDLLGYRAEELVGQSIDVIFGDGTLQFKKSWLDELNEKGSLSNIETTYLTKDGRKIPVLFSSSIMSYNNGSVQGIVCVALDITERKHIEKEKDKLLKAIDHSNDGIIIADEKDQYIYLNEAYAKIYGYPKEELIGETWRKLIPSELITATELELDRTIHNKNVNMLSGEFPILKKDGTTISVEAKATGLWDEKGSYQGHICIVRDITERKRTEDKLRKSKESFSKAEKIGHFGYWEWDLATNKLVWSDEVFRLYGLDPQKVIPTYETVISTLSSENKEWFIKSVSDTLNNNAPFEGEYSIFRPDGSVRYTHTIGEVIRDRDRKPISMFGVVQDITERKHAEEELLKFKLGIERSDEVIFITNIEGSIIYINPAFEKIYGYTKEEALGKTPRILKSGLLPSEAYKTFWDTLLEKKVVNGDLVNKTKDGRLLNIGGSANPILNDDRNIVGFLAIQRDITERKLTEEHIKKSLQEKETLLKEIHHRVKNNLQIVSSLLDHQAQYIKDKNVIDIFTESQNRIVSMSLVHEKLYQSKDLAKIEFNEYINDLAANLFQSYVANSGKITLNMNIENIQLDIDFAIPCGLIINELVTNSLKYAFPAGSRGEIKIAFRKMDEDENMLEFVVGDNGIGLPKDLDFRKTDSLGLHLVTTLAENQLHGEINLDRSKGTEFQIKFRGIK